MSSDLSIGDIKKRVVTSFLSLTARQVALRALSFVTINIILAKILPVETLGIFNIATALITFFAFFSDVGLAASLIQKKDGITKEDIKTTFTIQQLIAFSLSLAIILAAPYAGNFYNLNQDGVWLIRVLGFSFFLSSLKVLPSVILEREIRFQPLVAAELIETLLYNGLLIYLSFSGFGLWSFSIAAIVKAISGVVVIYLLAPVKLGIGVDKKSAKELLSFGIPFQLNNVLALIKDRLVPLVIARMVGPLGIGYITWSQSLAFLPLDIMQIIIRITFPAFSRLQDNKEALQKAVEKSLFATSAAVYPAIFGLGAILPAMVTYVVSPKWQNSVPSFYLFAISAYWAVISTILTNTLNAIGMIRITLKLMVFWTIATWILTPVLVYFYGFIGVGIASFIISFSSFITIVIVKRILRIRIIDSVILPTLASATMGLTVFLLSYFFVRDWFSLILTIILGAFLYLLIVLLLGWERVMADINSLKKYG